MALPLESQMFLGPALDLTDPLASMFMAGSEAFPQPMWSMPPYYPLGQNYAGAMPATAAPAAGMSAALPGAASTTASTSACIRPQKLFNSGSAQDGISATLAPSALDLSAATAALKSEASTGAHHHHTPAAAAMNVGPLATPSLLPTATPTPSGMAFPPTSSSYFSLKPDDAAGPTKPGVSSDQQSPLATPSLPPGGGVLQPVPVGGEDWGQFINDILWE
jgi:hypothetical protein